MKKLLIVVGAGASVEFGMPSVAAIDKLLEEWALGIMPIHDGVGSLYSWFKEKYGSYAKRNERNEVWSLSNFENILFAIQSISALLKDIENGIFKSKIGGFVEVIDFPLVKRFGKIKKADGNDLSNLHSHLIDNLLEYFRELCSKLEENKKEEINALRNFLQLLESEFEIGVINFNYDNVILSAMPSLKTGFDKDSGEFERSIVYEKNWNFCYHLHGSVHFDMKGGKNQTQMHKILWNDDLNSQFSQNSSGRNGNSTSEGLGHLNTNIIAGLDKVNQVLREPFGTYFMQLDRLAYEADAILFMGYGFNDLHLNKIMPFIRYDESKRRKVVVISWASDDEDGLSFRHDEWSSNLFATIPVNAREMGNGKNSLPQPVSYFKSSKTLEKSLNPAYPLAIWYNGMLEACNNPTRIIQELI